MIYLSVCSGIEAATVAWHPLGWQPVAFSEIEKFPSQVLAHHYPDVPNLGDMTKFQEWTNVTNVDVLVGGTPCQSFSVAGLRKGLHDPRGGLMLTFIEIAQRHRPRWIVWENVPGVLSSNGGRDFGSFLAALGELGYGWAYRVLDAQWFGVAQRRRRVFVVGCLGDQQSAAKVLFESESVCRNPAPSRQAREEVASGIAPSVGTGGSNDMTPMIAISSGSDPELMATLCAKDNEKWGCNQWVSEGKAVLQPSYALVGNTIGRKPENGGNGNGWSEEISYTLTKTDVYGVAQPIPIDSMNHIGRSDKHSMGDFVPGAPSYTLTKGHHHAVAQPIPFGVGEKPEVGHCLRSGASKADKHESTTYVAQPIGLDEEQNARINGFGTLMARMEGGGFEGTVMTPAMQVRRLTPVECERLQGFPDGYTDIKENTPDGPRYKALGNSMAVPVMRWIGQRIQKVEDICATQK